MKRERSARAACPRVDRAWLAAHALPAYEPAGDKESRGRVLVIAGSYEIPGAAILSATAALRAGAGKVTVLTDDRVAVPIGIAVPEARVLSFPASKSGKPRVCHIARTAGDLREQVDATLIGPGLHRRAGARNVLDDLLEHLSGVPLVVDGVAMEGLRPRTDLRRDAPVVLTPHAGELAELTRWKKEDIRADPEQAAQHAASHWGVHVLLKGATTVFAAPDVPGLIWQHECAIPGLGVSGSGDVLAGVLAGMLARGADVASAAAWATAVHARAGAHLAERIAPTGYVARELSDEVPLAIAHFEVS